MNTRLTGLRLIERAIGGCLKLLEDMKISADRTDDDLREIKRDFERAKTAVNNSLHTYNKNKKGE